MKNVCERCSLCDKCKGIKHDPNECECIENFYNQFLDSDDFICEDKTNNIISAA